MLTLRNPHSALAAIETRPADVVEVRLSRRSPQPAWQQVVERAKAAGAPVRISAGGDDSSRRRSKDDKEGRTGSAEATVREREPVALADLFATDSPRGLWLALDQVQDPHNIGAIFRTAAFFGVRGIVLTRHKSAPMSAVVYDVASGGAEHVPFAIETNLRQCLDIAKDAGLWVLGASEHARQTLWELDRDRRWLLVLGNEEQGMRRLTEETCDEMFRIPALGAIGSLNVSVAAGVAIGVLTR